MAFVITVDAILALSVAGLLIMWTTDLMTSHEFRNEDILTEYGYDFLAVAEKNNALDELMEFNSTGFRAMLQQIPDSLCVQAIMNFQNGSFYYHADNYNDTQIGIKTGCLKRYTSGEARPVTFVKVSRIETYNGVIHPITLELWFKGWKD